MEIICSSRESNIHLANGEYITRSTVMHIDIIDIASDKMKQSTSKFMDPINLKIGNETFALNLGYTQFNTIYYDTFNDTITDNDNGVPYNSSDTAEIYQDLVSFPYKIHRYKSLRNIYHLKKSMIS